MAILCSSGFIAAVAERSPWLQCVVVASWLQWLRDLHGCSSGNGLQWLRDLHGCSSGNGRQWLRDLHNRTVQ